MISRLLLFFTFIAFAAAFGQADEGEVLYPTESIELKLVIPKESSEAQSIRITNKISGGRVLLDPKLDPRFSTIIRYSDQAGGEQTRLLPKIFFPPRTNIPSRLEKFLDVSKDTSVPVGAKLKEYISDNRAQFSSDGEILEILMRVDLSGFVLPEGSLADGFSREDVYRARFYSPWIKVAPSIIRAAVKDLPK